MFVIRYAITKPIKKDAKINHKPNNQTGQSLLLCIETIHSNLKYGEISL